MQSKERKESSNYKHEIWSIYLQARGIQFEIKFELKTTIETTLLWYAKKLSVMLFIKFTLYDKITDNNIAFEGWTPLKCVCRVNSCLLQL